MRKVPACRENYTAISYSRFRYTLPFSCNYFFSLLYLILVSVCEDLVPQNPHYIPEAHIFLLAYQFRWKKMWPYIYSPSIKLCSLQTCWIQPDATTRGVVRKHNSDEKEQKTKRTAHIFPTILYICSLYHRTKKICTPNTKEKWTCGDDIFFQWRDVYTMLVVPFLFENDDAIRTDSSVRMPDSLESFLFFFPFHSHLSLLDNNNGNARKNLKTLASNRPFFLPLLLHLATWLLSTTTHTGHG